MAEFLVSPPEAIEWTVATPAFAEAVVKRWPGAGVREYGAGAHLRASAWVRADDPWDGLLLELHPNGHTLGVDTRSRATAAEVACWWRTIVPPDVSVLWLYDRGFAGRSEIRMDTSPDELFQPATR